MHISVRGAKEHNLQNVDAEISAGLTVVTGVSGSGKSSLVFDTIYHEARRRFLDVFATAAASRLAPADVERISGLGPAVSVGQNLLNRNPNSTLASAAGLHPFVRLLYAHFSQQACSVCGAPHQNLHDEILLETLAAYAAEGPVQLYARLLDGEKLSHGALLSGLADMFGQEALRVDGQAWRGERLDPATSHRIDLRVAEVPTEPNRAALRGALRQARAMGALVGVVLAAAMEHPFPLAAVCLECGAWYEEARPEDFNRPCPHCSGKGCAACEHTGLHPHVLTLRWQGLRFDEFMRLRVDQAEAIFAGAPDDAFTPRLQAEILRRLRALQQVGLGYLSLERVSPTLSRGEAQRVRLAVTMVSRLEDMLHVLDEPTIGLHPADTERLVDAFRSLPGPVIMVEHDRMAAARADWAVDLGPGAGSRGGRVVYQGDAPGLWRSDTPSGRAFSAHPTAQPAPRRPAAGERIRLVDVALRNLKRLTVEVPVGRMTVVSGVSGSGKSTLVEDVLVASLEGKRPVGCQQVIGKKLQPVLVDQSPIGRNPRSNPATYTGLANVIRDVYSLGTGLAASRFSFNRPEGACAECQGLGAIEVSMRYLPSTWVACPVCGGDRFSEEVLAARLAFGGEALSIADFLKLSVEEVHALLAASKLLIGSKQQTALRILSAMQDIGLGYLQIGQPSTTLSGGEAQRIKLAKFLGKKSLAQQLLVMDEPSTGLHPQDLAGLIVVLNRLVDAGATVVIVEHNLDVIRAADWIIDLGPGSGPSGGEIVYMGSAAGLAACRESATAQALEMEARIQPAAAVPSDGYRESDAIRIRGARIHNLKDVSVDIPKRKLTVVTGVSGSGKSSLVSDVLESEARRRYLETLSLYERQGTHEGPEAEVDAITGLGVAITAAPEKLTYSRRSTVGLATDVSRHLAILLTESVERICAACGAGMERSERAWTCPQCGETAPIGRPQQFMGSTYSSACLKCHGVGSINVPQPDKVIIAPEKPLLAGAMYSPGFFPKGYLGKPLNYGYYLTLAMAERHGFDPFHTPWSAMPAEAQRAFLFGDPTKMMVTFTGHSGRSSTREASYPGFYGFINDWDVGNTYTDNIPCPECGGARLRQEYLAVGLGGLNIHQMSQLPLRGLGAHVQAYALPERSSKTAQLSLEAVRKRLAFLEKVGLGYLNLYRPVGTLSAGEVQRIRLASLLNSGLTSLTILLDEPTRGLHPSEVQALVEALQALRDEGNTVIVVEHDPLVMRSCDHLIDMGPGAGQAGGEVVASGAPETVSRGDGLTAQWLRGERRMSPTSRKTPRGWLSIIGATENNLQGDPVQIPLGALVGVCGVSGSGKSTLIMDTLGRALVPKKQTTSVAYEPLDPGKHERIEGAPKRVLLVDQSRAGMYSPAAFLGLNDALRKLFARSASAQMQGVTEAMLSAGCSVCNGRGSITLDMAFLPDVRIPCEACKGTGFIAEAWQVRYRGHALPEVFGMSLAQAHETYGDEDSLERPLRAALDVGLGYLQLRQPGHSLSGGEAQRLKVAQELSKRSQTDALYIMDEPTVGQHLEDVQRLTTVLRRLVAEGGSVLVVEHHAHLLAACDWLIELGPGGGPEGGRVIAAGTPETLASGSTPSAAAIEEVLSACR